MADKLTDQAEEHYQSASENAFSPSPLPSPACQSSPFLFVYCASPIDSLPCIRQDGIICVQHILTNRISSTIYFTVCIQSASLASSPFNLGLKFRPFLNPASSFSTGLSFCVDSWGKIAEHKMHVCARALEQGNITTIPFVLVNYAEFYEFGNKVEVLPTTMIRYAAYVDGIERQSTGNSAELEGLVTGIL
jgi:hypothetical protein